MVKDTRLRMSRDSAGQVLFELLMNAADVFHAFDATEQSRQAHFATSVGALIEIQNA